MAVTRGQMSIWLRVWLFVYRYSLPAALWILPASKRRHSQFNFVAEQPVRWIEATSYGMTAGLDENFDHLAAATGWKIVYPRF